MLVSDVYYAYLRDKILTFVCIYILTIVLRNVYYSAYFYTLVRSVFFNLILAVKGLYF